MGCKKRAQERMRRGRGARCPTLCRIGILTRSSSLFNALEFEGATTTRCPCISDNRSQAPSPGYDGDQGPVAFHERVGDSLTGVHTGQLPLASRLHRVQVSRAEERVNRSPHPRARIRSQTGRGFPSCSLCAAHIPVQSRKGRTRVGGSAYRSQQSGVVEHKH